MKDDHKHKQHVELVEYKRDGVVLTTQQAVRLWACWLVAGTVNGLIPVAK